MDLISIVFVVFVVTGLFLAVLSIIGIVVEYALNKEENNFDDVERIKQVMEETNKHE